jgi:tetratricopeptide (TPR) repeat protein
MERVGQLEQFLKEEPEDPFNYYALALEYLKTDTPKALVLFKTLLQSFPEYLPTYYPYAHLLIDLGQKQEAEGLFEKGKEVALKKNDQKTLRELQSAYNDWLFDRD